MAAETARKPLRALRGTGLYVLVVAIAYLATLLAGSALAPLRDNVQNVIFDQYQRWRPRPTAEPRLVKVLDIDDESIRRLGQWPWPRETMSRIVQALTKADVAAIAFDVLFSEAERGGGNEDGRFATAIAAAPVVLGEALTRNPTPAPPVKSGFAVVGGDPLIFLPKLPGALGPLPALADAASGVGFVNWQPDADRVVRKAPLLYGVNGQLQASLALEALRVAQRASTYVVRSEDANSGPTGGRSAGVEAIKNGDLVIPTQADGAMRAYFALRDPQGTMPIWRAIEPDADLSALAGKIVLIGASASLLADVVATPLDPSTPGVEAQAQIIDQLAQGATLLRPDWGPGAELVAAAGLSLVLAVATPLISAAWAGLFGALAAAAMAGASWYAFSQQGLLIDPFAPSASSGLVFLAGVLVLYSQKRRQLSETRAVFGRFVAPAVVARLAENPELIRLGGEERTLTVMFCDLRSFTTVSEGLNATELTAFLNEYLTPMTDAILERIGTVDKYMGDAIMAFWNAPLDDADHAANAARAALQMRAILADLNRNWAERAAAGEHSRSDIKFGVGLNTGECCVGNLGSTRRFDYSAIGDEVNVASRLEGASKVFGVDIVASAATRAAAADFAWLEVDQVLLKNKTRPTSVFTLVGDSDYAGSPAFETLAEAHASLLEAYRAGHFARASELAEAAAKLAPEEIRGLYASYYRDRFASLAVAAEGGDWEPVFKLETK